MCFSLRATKICRWEGLWTVSCPLSLGREEPQKAREGGPTREVEERGWVPGLVVKEEEDFVRQGRGAVSNKRLMHDALTWSSNLWSWSGSQSRNLRNTSKWHALWWHYSCFCQNHTATALWLLWNYFCSLPHRKKKKFIGIYFLFIFLYFLLDHL